MSAGDLHPPTDVWRTSGAQLELMLLHILQWSLKLKLRMYCTKVGDILIYWIGCRVHIRRPEKNSPLCFFKAS